MTAIVTVQLKCNGAGETFTCLSSSPPARTIVHARKYASDAGWLVGVGHPGGKRDYCAECRKEVDR